MFSERTYPIGAEITRDGANFRVWAPEANSLTLIVQTESDRFNQEMANEGNGYYSCLIPGLPPGTLYQFQTDKKPELYPDPASRYQPEGPHGPSQIESSETFTWSDSSWRGINTKRPVIYEMHIGTFTEEGTYLAAANELAELAELGITVIELMPLNEFDGNFGWGYDGVALYAPYHNYGTPDELRYFIDKAHAVGIGVILDVVYNHIGSSGCYLHRFSKSYFSKRFKSEWGDVFNFDEKNSAPVREFIINNAIYWIKEFHFDGFRLDATQQIYDSSDQHIIAALVNAAREAADYRELYIIGENEPQQRKLLVPTSEGGYGLDALWNDDFHHTTRVALTGNTGAYFTDYKGESQEFVSSVKYGFLYQGQWYKWQNKCRGSQTFGLQPGMFVHYLQSHDQIANGGLGRRIHQLSQPGSYRALTALLLLSPQTPMLFQGQEFGSSKPFLYFADNNDELKDIVANGRNQFLHQFLPLATPAMQSYLSRPEAIETFKNGKLDFNERKTHAHIYQLHKDLLHLRKTDAVICGDDYCHIDGAVISPSAFVLRFFSSSDGNDRLLIVNLGRELSLSPAPEPLLAPPEDQDWTLYWSSELPQYGGHGACEISTKADWSVPGLSATLLKPVVLNNKEDNAKNTTKKSSRKTGATTTELDEREANNG